MKSTFFLIITVITVSCFNACAQKPDTKANPFQMVVIPDSIKLKMAKIELNKEKIEGVFDSAYTAINVYNLINRNDYTFKDGIYSWKVMGPHFERRLMIHNKGETYLFKGQSVEAVIKEYVECMVSLELTTTNKLKYLSVISDFLEEEHGKTN